MSGRPEYPVQLTFNGRSLKRVIIDLHYRDRHAESMSDELILKLVVQLDGENFPVQKSTEDFDYFVADPVLWEEKSYRVVLVIQRDNDFLGVVNAFRVKEKKL
jgi:hypothetical protein